LVLVYLAFIFNFDENLGKLISQIVSMDWHLKHTAINRILVKLQQVGS